MWPSLRSLGRTFGALGTLLMGSIFVLESSYAKSRPRVADVQSGLIYPLNVHGIVYITGKEQFHLHLLEFGAVICIVCFAFSVYLEMRRRKGESKIGTSLRRPH